MYLGPFHFTGEISLGSLMAMAGMLWACFKFLRHYLSDIKTSNERTTKLWQKFNGKYDGDPNGWFRRLEITEYKVNTIWEKLYFNRINIDETKERRSDVG